MSSQTPYNEYLRTPIWQAKRRAALKRAGYRCQVCDKNKGLAVHHRNYDRLGMEYDSDLIVLCEKCHSIFHKKPQRETREEKKAKLARLIHDEQMQAAGMAESPKEAFDEVWGEEELPF